MKKKAPLVTKIFGIFLLFLTSKIHSSERPEDANEAMRRSLHRSQGLHNSEIFSGEEFETNGNIEFLKYKYYLEKKFKANLAALGAYCKGFFSPLEISSPETDEILSRLLPLTYGRLPKVKGTINTFDNHQITLHYFKESLRFTQVLNGNFSISDAITWLKNSLKSGVPFYYLVDIVDDLGKELNTNLQDKKKYFKGSSSEKIFMSKHREIICNFIQALQECLPQTKEQREPFINFENTCPIDENITFERDNLSKFQNYRKNLFSFNKSSHIYLSFLFKEISLNHSLKKLKNDFIEFDPLSEKNFKDIAAYQSPEQSLRDLIVSLKKVIIYRNEMLGVENSQSIYPFSFLAELEKKLNDKKHLQTLKISKDLLPKVFKAPHIQICAPKTLVETQPNIIEVDEIEVPLLPTPQPPKISVEPLVETPPRDTQAAVIGLPLPLQEKMAKKKGRIDTPCSLLPKKTPLIQTPLPLSEEEKKIAQYKLLLAELLVSLRKEKSMIFEDFFKEIEALQFRVCKKKGNGSALSIYPTQDNILYPPNKFMVIHGPSGKMKRSTPIPWGYIYYIYSGFKVVFKMSLEEATELLKNAKTD